MSKRGFFTGRHYPIYLFVAVIVFLAITAINPPHPDDFIYEHIMTAVFLIILAATYKKFRFSNISYTMIFAFMILHIIGARFTYAEVPYNDFFISLFGFSVDSFFGFTRNNFDRLVHFSFGLLLAYPLRELFWRIGSARGVWRYYFPLDFVMASSMLYELIEFGFAVVIGGDVSHTYLGSQGDVWDAQKDMLLATIGGLITLTITFIINLRYNKNLRKEMKQSFTIKRKAPLGEVELKRLIRQSKK